jgi:hypothetical protein
MTWWRSRMLTLISNAGRRTAVGDRAPGMLNVSAVIARW